MNLGSILYTIFIGPLKLLFEVVYTFAYFITGNAGLSIIALSLVMNVLLLPLYKRADDVQEKENQIQKKLKKGVDHIKKAFKGDEQYMVLNTYYRQNGYKPIYALRSSISLLLQIPFFIAAYDFLSNEYTVLSSSFGPIGSLGSPDHLLGGVNLLPIAMTVINIISSIIYTKGQPLKNNIQLYIMALAFLVFLYDRPSGLVFYWTLNNLFSLIKNIFMKLKNARIILAVLLSLGGLGFLIIVLFIHPFASFIVQATAILIALMMEAPLIMNLFFKDRELLKNDGKPMDDKLFYIEVLFLSIYFGLFIPCQVIEASPSEFIDMVTMTAPTTYIFNTLFLSIGTFGVWFTIYYILMDTPIRKVFQYLLAIMCILFAVNYLGFGRDLGLMSNMLIYDEGMFYTVREKLINLAVMVIGFVILTIIYRRKKQVLTSLLIVMIIVSSILSVTNIFKIQKIVSEAMVEIRKAKEDKAQIHLSRSGKNVVVIILDRAVNSYIPFIFNEKPELVDKFDGFVYYPNTMSYSSVTNVAIPSVYGGYEYTPDGMNARDSELLMDKHNEALKVMPVLFLQNGYDVTVFDPAYANYKSPGDLSVYDDYPEIHRYNTEAGMFQNDPSLVRDHLDLLNRNLFCFGITKSAPLILQNTLYNGGAYNSINRYESLFSKDELLDVSSKAYVKESFVNSFSVLQNMTKITDISNDSSDNFLLMYNCSTHEPTLLQTPDYEMKANVDNYEFDQETGYSRNDGEGNTLPLKTYEQMSHYHINIASMQELSVWFDYLRENDVYDNTRIIIVADHGAGGLLQNPDMILDDVDLMPFNPLLMVKDFDSHTFRTDPAFMTNADTIVLATDDVIDDPINPFTGNAITAEQKHQGYQHILFTYELNVRENNGTTYKPGTDLKVKDDFFDLNNWIKE